jgi:hypothetical protein
MGKVLLKMLSTFPSISCCHQEAVESQRLCINESGAYT